MNLFEALTGPLARMSYVNRYSSYPVNRRENVAEHTFWVCLISYLVGQDIFVRTQYPVVFEMLFKRAIAHDLSECLSGDVIRSYKHSNPEIKGAMARADEENMMSLVAPHGLVGESVELSWMVAKDETVEGRIVAFADMAAVAFYCREEDRSGNRAIRQVLKEMYEQWFHVFHEDDLFAPYMDQMFPRRMWPDMLREEVVTAEMMFSQERVRPMLPDHSEGPTAEHDYAQEGPGSA